MYLYIFSYKYTVYLADLSSVLGDLLFKLYFTKCNLRELSFEMLNSFQNVQRNYCSNKLTASVERHNFCLLVFFTVYSPIRSA